MQQIIEKLTDRLYDKDVLPLELPRLIRDVLYIVNDEKLLNVESINMRLQVLGWRKGILDDYVLQLILHLAETQGDDPVESSMLH